MKKLGEFLRNGYPMMTLLLVSVFLISCGGGQDREAKKKLDETKEQTVLNINRIKIDIEERIAYVNEEMEEATGETREKLKEARENLKAQKELLEVELEKVKAASIDTWNETVASASQSITDARRKTNEISKNVREMLDAEE
ncbi:MAG: hypothetical protein EA361_02875 [Bacteroidetes bacterium]|nr:MAG: hypothetical protein EA361_02875 [Bacteroidota bacterium]